MNKISKYDLEKFIFDNQTKMIKINDPNNKEYKRLKIINRLAMDKFDDITITELRL